MQHNFGDGCQLILGLPNDVVMKHIFPKVKYFIERRQFHTKLLDRYMVLSMMKQTSTHWKSIMEQKMDGIAMFYKANPSPRVTW